MLTRQRLASAFGPLGVFGAASIFLSVLAVRLHRARLAEAVSITQQQELALLDMGNLLVLDQDRRKWGSSRLRMNRFRYGNV